MQTAYVMHRATHPQCGTLQWQDSRVRLMLHLPAAAHPPSAQTHG
eukprot:CAMPEP_0202420792 /NCGR_PEP_ID=MMETSP1128-20130828/50002_1 /ASSEMBLY_ACC=CAM_ASM_000463 /TAXON_ID=3047 /ORGANISM="Dunaliella tertiolecta, Strain CCMP1320" /LENGTH=44 /DNA_ID= /DNA_START= /DNA_END= /DNA_ORIENTATION=